MTEPRTLRIRTADNAGFSASYGIFSVGLVVLAGTLLAAYLFAIDRPQIDARRASIGLGLLVICELVVCASWIRLTTQRLTALGYPKRTVMVPIIAWIVSFALPIGLVLISPDSDDPGPVGAAFLMMALVVLSILISAGFVITLVLPRRDDATSAPSTSRNTDFGSI